MWGGQRRAHDVFEKVRKRLSETCRAARFRALRYVASSTAIAQQGRLDSRIDRRERRMIVGGRNGDHK
jgi:hypothetical protein